MLLVEEKYKTVVRLYVNLFSFSVLDKKYKPIYIGLDVIQFDLLFPIEENKKLLK